ncbi:serine/threonine-protein kinase [Streptomyces sp. NPDC059080]|uniref:serine/threonine-protein kinase n=1 Tax=Streptomyces sp. NPDC059080 TaxID=3346718 RepID=UPI00369E50C0
MGEIFAGRYELVDPVGRGGVGAVWRAWDHRRRRYVAAKVLQQSDAHTLLRFVREQAMRIDHPHVLAPASWAADDAKVLFTMDLVHGGSLAHLIGDYGPLPPRYVCTLLDQLLAGLTAVHDEGVVHRDIKPANILLEATGTGRPHLRLSDFGIAMRKGEPRLTETNYVVGTPGYFAPEQMLGAEPDFPADLFAVGLVALYLITGTKPDADALVRHFTEYGVPHAPEGVPEPLWQVLATLLHPDPESRFRTATGARKAVLAAVELLPEAGLDDEAVEVFDHIGPLPEGFGPDGPLAAPRDGGAAGSGAPGATGTPLPPSGTGSFVLAPPGQPLPQPPATPPVPVAAPHVPAPATPPGTPPSGTYRPTAGSWQQPPATRPYTSPQPPAVAPPVPPGVPEPAAPEAVRRPGPPAKVAVPVLAVALLCIAFGIWALTVS